MTANIVLLANPENRRAAMFQDALTRTGRPQAPVVSWEDWLAGRERLEERLRPGDVLRIESPGENFAVEKLLLLRGEEAAAAEGAPLLPAAQIERLSLDRGLILHPRQWYLGFSRALAEIEQALQATGARAMNAPHAIAAMFDKRRCHAIFPTAGVPVPESLEASCYEELVSHMQARTWRRAFVKLAHGSSASGVVAYQRGQRQCAATTSAEVVRDRGGVKLYNSLKVRRYADERDIADLIDALCRERVHVERWLPKASLAGGIFDLRVVVVAGRARQAVVRHGRSPMTNLHLGNARGSFEEFLQTAGKEVWSAVADSCRRAAAALEDGAASPAVLYAGVDVLLTPGFRRHAVLEINAFGDLLPGVFHEGQDTYAAEVAAIA